MAGIDIHALHHRYPDSAGGLHDINLSIADGEFLALVGPSGSGKTTLLRTLAGFLRPTAGTVRVGGSVVAGPGSWVPAQKRGLGMVFQEHAIWPHLDVAGNIGYPLKRARVPHRQATARINEVLDQVGLADYARRRPAALSGGQRQRVALARAIVAKPRALLLDEALSALDEPLRARLRLELRRLTRQEGLTAVHVTHDRAEALALADRVAVLQDGHIAQVGTPEQLRTGPASAFVAFFLADATLFPGTLVGDRFHPDHPGLIMPPPTADELGPGTYLQDAAPGTERRSRRAVAAVAPTAIELQGAMVASTDEFDGTQLARVTSVLRTAHGYETSLDWGGTEVRVMATGIAPTEGDVVRPRVRAARVYAGQGHRQQVGAP